MRASPAHSHREACTSPSVWVSDAVSLASSKESCLLLGWLAGADPALVSPYFSGVDCPLPLHPVWFWSDLSEAWHQPFCQPTSLSPPCPAPPETRPILDPSVCWDSLASLLSPRPWVNPVYARGFFGGQHPIYLLASRLVPPSPRQR